MFASHRAQGFRNKDLKKILGDNWKISQIAYQLLKLRERGAIVKLKNTHYYRLTQQGYQWLFYAFYNQSYFVDPLLSKSGKNELKKKVLHPSNIEKAYNQIDAAVSVIMKELGISA